jgi:myo-inositol-1(or 4)-monophosphatase
MDLLPAMSDLLPDTARKPALPPLSVLCDAAREAGEIALRYFGNSPKTWTKPGNSPVTEADLAIDAMLHTELRRAYPSFGWLSEEIEDDGSRLGGAPTFIVDPIDGTRGFMAGRDDWAVSLALVDGARPAQAVLFNPARGSLLYAQAGKGAHIERENGTVCELAPTGKETIADALLAFPGPSKPSQTYRKADWIASLALRISRVADGTLDGCVAKPNAKHWDIAAADLIVHEAGLALQHGDGATPIYNGPNIAHPALVAGTTALCAQLRTHLPHA